MLGPTGNDRAHSGGLTGTPRSRAKSAWQRSGLKAPVDKMARRAPSVCLPAVPSTGTERKGVGGKHILGSRRVDGGFQQFR